MAGSAESSLFAAAHVIAKTDNPATANATHAGTKGKTTSSPYLSLFCTARPIAGQPTAL